MSPGQLAEDTDTSSWVIEFAERGDKESLKKVLKLIPPFTIASLIADEKKEMQSIIFGALEFPSALEVFDFLPPRIQRNLLCSISNHLAGELLNALSPDDRTALLQEMSHTEINEMIKFLPAEERTLTLALLGYPEGSVGRLMTPDYIAIGPDWSIQRVLDYLLEYGHDSETISLLYVIDEKGKLLDDIKLRDFLFVSRELKVQSLMDNQFIALQVDSNDEAAINTFRTFNRVAMPVIDHEGTLLGIVTIDDILRLSNEEATEDIQKIGGLEALDEPYMLTPFLRLMKKRAGWLMLLFLGEMLTASVLSYYESEIARAVVLALFLPLIISSGGNAGSQASTLIIRAMALGEVRLKDWWKVIKRELASGLFLGIILGIIGFARIAIWSQFTTIYGQHWFLVAATIFFSLIGVVLWGTLSGAIFPIILRSFKVDPATSSAPFVATIVDVTGLVIYFAIAIALLGGTIL